MKYKDMDVKFVKMSNKDVKMFNKVSYLIREYHRCGKIITKGAYCLERELQALEQPLMYAKKWTHRDGDRIGVCFYDTHYAYERWISVPIVVFDNREYEAFAKKYCKVGEDE